MQKITFCSLILVLFLRTSLYSQNFSTSLTDIYMGGTQDHPGQIYLQTKSGDFVKKDELYHGHRYVFRFALDDTPSNGKRIVFRLLDTFLRYDG